MKSNNFNKYHFSEIENNVKVFKNKSTFFTLQ